MNARFGLPLRLDPGERKGTPIDMFHKGCDTFYNIEHILIDENILITADMFFNRSAARGHSQPE
jgi:hypothetical protein